VTIDSLQTKRKKMGKSPLLGVIYLLTSGDLISVRLMNLCKGSGLLQGINNKIKSSNGLRAASGTTADCFLRIPVAFPGIAG
jgi:hypothetical protein